MTLFKNISKRAAMMFSAGRYQNTVYIIYHVYDTHISNM